MQKNDSDHAHFRASTLQLGEIVSAHLLIMSIFSGGFPITIGTTQLGSGPLFAILSIPPLLQRKKSTAPKFLLIALVIIFIQGILGIISEFTSPYLFAKTYASTATFYIAFYMLCRKPYRCEYSIRLYLKYSLAIALVGIIQAIFFVAGVPLGYNFSWISSGLSPAPGGLLGLRISSLLYEPSQVAFTMAPAIALSIFQLARLPTPSLSNMASIIIIVFSVLSSSSTVLIVFLLAILALLLINQRYAALLAIGIPLATIFLIAYSPSVSQSSYFAPTIAKVKGLMDLSTMGRAAQSADATTFTLFENARLAFLNFSRSWGFGGSLGSHELLYDKTLSLKNLPHAVHNKNSAGNLLFRVISELGILGLLFLSWFFVSRIKIGTKQLKSVRPVYFAFIIGAAIFLVRNGTYAHYGLSFYIILLFSFPRREAEKVNVAK